MALCEPSDVEAALGRVLTTAELGRAGALIEQVSEQYKWVAGQTFEPGSTTARLRVSNSRIYLPERVATAVTAVVDDEGYSGSWTLTGQKLLVKTANGLKVPSGVMLTVTYAFTGVVPALDRLTVAAAVGRNLTLAAPALTGVTRHTETMGPYTTTDEYAAWAVGGSSLLAPNDVLIARRWIPAGRGPHIARSQ